ncbi:fluoride efflux transporter CrcB [Antrihabitans sp. YC3-6]|uniref:Fluoride-specific ion channel FluC n=1 Tax=Antrihabitans stalagmiti TaxID=2799499 RepID=A0A934U1P7_9NOCA|nr:fluoride efflux transporter CrcB [Antrihabitans stalagmiti]MBJ8338267.1 fluoride efflux transporter CrcB [Antrihabitans stalagmiti]
MQKQDLAVLGAIAVGGGIGAVSRYGVGHLLPPVPGHIPWSTLLINTTGCLLIGVLMVLITEVWTVHRLVRPFFGVGILGGFTTFSTYAVEVHTLFDTADVVLPLVYLFGTVLAAVTAVMAGMAATRAISGVGSKSGDRV